MTAPTRAAEPTRNSLVPFGRPARFLLVVLAVVISRVKGMRTMEARQEQRVRDMNGVRP